VLDIFSRSRDGRMRQRINFKLRSTAWFASLKFCQNVFLKRCITKRQGYLVGSIIGARSARRGPSLPCGFFSQPTAAGRPASFDAPPPICKAPKRLFHVDCGVSESLQQRMRRVDVESGYRARRYARRFRRGQPGFVGCAEGSTNAIVCYWRGHVRGNIT
jgi:hypothetical protein